MSNERILVVEDRDSLRRMMCLALAGEGFQVCEEPDVEPGLARIRADAFDLVLTDLKLPGGTGLEILAAAREHQPRTPVVVLTAFGTVAHAVEAMKLGAVDFLEKPLELDELFAIVRAHTGGRADEPGNGDDDIPIADLAEGAPDIVGRHPSLKAALRLLRKVAPTETTVLLTGESGTGKELFARALHALSPRSTGPFVAVNCAAIPETLMENELFGHEKGAYTGAVRRQAGRFERAGGGTLFLDEIGELALEVQGKVLRVLEERTFERVGGGSSMHADVRLVAATNRDLESMTQDGRFRADLFFRLDVFPIVLPPLRTRRSDIGPLARYLLEGIARRLGRTPPALDVAAEARLCEEPWPGNVRQLANLLERVSILTEGARIGVEDLETLLHAGGADPRETVRRALAATDGDKRAAAERLGVSYRTLLRRVKAFDLEGYPKYRP